jgi:hypothetical protein
VSLAGTHNYTYKNEISNLFLLLENNSEIKSKINDTKSHQHRLLDLHHHFRSVNGIFCCGWYKAFAAGHSGNT